MNLAALRVSVSGLYPEDAEFPSVRARERRRRVDFPARAKPEGYRRELLLEGLLDIALSSPALDRLRVRVGFYTSSAASTTVKLILAETFQTVARTDLPAARKGAVTARAP